MTQLAFELRTNTPRPLIAPLAERVEADGYRSLWVNHPPDAIVRRVEETGLPSERLRLGIGSGFGPEPLQRMADARAEPPRSHRPASCRQVV